MVEIFASLAGIAIENARNFQEHIDSRRDAELYTDLLSHDIKNYHQAILGYLDFLRSKMKEKENATLIDKVTEQVMNASWLASNVRTMSRVTFGEVEHARVDLGSVLLQCNKAVIQYLPARRIVFLTEIEEGQYFTRADELIKELFINILTNAVKYDSHPVVEIEISVSRTFDEQGKKSWVVAIGDHGAGIPDEEKSIIFDRFSKASKKKGSGLGLHIVRTLATRYGGSVWVEDRVKGDHAKGCVFKVRLPASD
jgi:signal transduction histidine kinase